MVTPAVDGIDLFKIAGRSISGWIPSLKTDTVFPLRQPFCSQLEERLLLWLEYSPQVVSYARGDIRAAFAKTYRLPTPKDAPFAIGYTFEGKPHDYLPDAVGILSNGTFFIAEAGMEDDKLQDRNLAKAEAARRLTRIRRGVFWIGTERTLTKLRHYNLVFLHARRKMFPTFAEIALAVQEIWSWGEVASVEEIESRLAGRWPANLVEAAIWKLVGDSAAAGHLLIDLERDTLDRKLPLALLPPDAVALQPPPLPDTLLADAPRVEGAAALPEQSTSRVGSTVDASTLPEKQREQFHRKLRAVELVLAGASQTSVANESGISRSRLSRLVQRTREIGQIACVPHGSYRRKSTMHPAFQECIHRLESEPDLVAVREQSKSLPHPRSSPESFVLSIPSPALLTQVDEHSLELYVVTPDGIAVTQRVHAAVLVCVKTAAILGAVLSLGPLKEEDYMRLVKLSLERKDHLVGSSDDNGAVCSGNMR